jgi:hypothetical protein
MMARFITCPFVPVRARGSAREGEGTGTEMRYGLTGSVREGESEGACSGKSGGARDGKVW